MAQGERRGWRKGDGSSGAARKKRERKKYRREKKLVGHCSIPLVLLLLFFFFFSLHQPCLAPAVQEILMCAPRSSPLSLCLHVHDSEREQKRECVREGGREIKLKKRGRDEGIKENIKRKTEGGERRAGRESERGCACLYERERERERSGCTAQRKGGLQQQRPLMLKIRNISLSGY